MEKIQSNQQAMSPAAAAARDYSRSLKLSLESLPLSMAIDVIENLDEDQKTILLKQYVIDGNLNVNPIAP
jgi:hypothetical protein